MIPVGGSALDSLNRNPRIRRLDTVAVVGLPGYYGNQDLPKQLFHNHIIEGSEHSLTHGVIFFLNTQESCISLYKGEQMVQLQ